MDLNKILGRDGWDRNRGLQHSTFAESLKRANADDDYDEGVPKTPGTDIADPYGTSVKPKGVPVWDTAPITPQEEEIYYGTHIHSESNPLGLHTHVKSGKLAGGHSHGPQNRFGSHYHGDKDPKYGVSLDGSHVHSHGVNMPCGKHTHCPENFA
jgi:hypothetical protein